MNDNALIGEIKSGNSQAFKDLVEQHQDLVVNTCYNFLRNRDDADDMAQDVALLRFTHFPSRPFGLPATRRAGLS